MIFFFWLVTLFDTGCKQGLKGAVLLTALELAPTEVTEHASRITF